MKQAVCHAFARQDLYYTPLQWKKMPPAFDALLIVSFGGPERTEDVIPFLENVLRGRDVPRERLLAVADHYYHFGGRSPINDQNRALISALGEVVKIPIYWGNRNWHPLLADTVRRMRDDGVRRAIAFPTSAFGSYSGCRQYLENIQRARAELGEEGAPEIVKIPPFSGHPLFLEAMTERVRGALAELPGARVVFTAHSVPVSMAQASPYVQQLEAASRSVAEGAGAGEWTLAYQSRSGPPAQPWLGPDICDYLRESPGDTIIAPIGFLSDHMEVIYDLDTEARAVCEELGIRMVRAGTVGTHPAIIRMIAELIKTEPDPCAATCCPAPQRPVIKR
jgi:ferrochelatase